MLAHQALNKEEYKSKNAPIYITETFSPLQEAWPPHNDA